MKAKISVLIFLSCLTAVPGHSQEELPDDYLPFSFHKYETKLEGGCEYLEGFTFSMNLPSQFLQKTFDEDELLSIVRNQTITGTLQYPNDKTTEIHYKVVNHRGSDDIYMKTSLGYFLWEILDISENQVYFAINWWYCPPARIVDLQALEMAEQLLSDSSNWHKTDDRKCEDDSTYNKWSLFCAIKYASIQKMGEYNHHNTAMQALRCAIDTFIPDHGFEHTLMDFNNAPSTTHHDVLYILDRAKQNIKKELKNQ
jgi:hypothetical protein